MRTNTTAADERAASTAARIGIAILTLALAGPGARAQGPTVEIALAARAATSSLPAVSWLCGTLLPSHEAWPADLEVGASLVVRLDSDGMSVAANSVPLPTNSLLVARVALDTGTSALCVCRPDGTEDWFLPRDATTTRRHRHLIDAINGTDPGHARVLDVGAAAGHLLGAHVFDHDTTNLQLTASLCGEVTWQWWHTDDYLRVRGRSDGGLLLPAVVLALADSQGNGQTDATPLRAYVSRDGERDEAVRQMARVLVTDREALRSMLHGSDELRLVAIDSLVHLGAGDELPRIVAAASSGMPLATLAATDAVAALWPSTTREHRDRAQDALARSEVAALRTLAVPEPDPAPAAELSSGAWERLLAVLLVSGTGLFVLWLRAYRQVHACT